MSSVTGEISITLKDGVTGPAKKINQTLTDMETKSKNAFNSMSNSSKAAGGSVQRTAAQMNNSTAANLGMATSVASVGASMVSLEASMTNVPKRLKAIEMAEVAMARVQDTVSSKQVRLKKQEMALTKARESGKKSAEEIAIVEERITQTHPTCLLYTSPSPRDRQKSRMPSSA